MAALKYSVYLAPPKPVVSDDIPRVRTGGYQDVRHAGRVQHGFDGAAKARS
jgi:hypothetical protein